MATKSQSDLYNMVGHFAVIEYIEYVGHTFFFLCVTESYFLFLLI